MRSKIWIILFLGLSIFGYFYVKNKQTKLYEMRIGEVTIKYELARTPKEVELGLSYREDLPEGQGMLFEFDKKGFRSFWMHEMLFPLDMIWIADNTVVQIDKNVPIKTNGAWAVVNSNYPVDKVLELKGGEVERMGIEIGKKIEYLGIEIF